MTSVDGLRGDGVADLVKQLCNERTVRAGPRELQSKKGSYGECRMSESAEPSLALEKQKPLLLPKIVYYETEEASSHE
jgi:hypothetical protein